jgi:hypothetical protein
MLPNLNSSGRDVLLVEHFTERFGAELEEHCAGTLALTSLCFPLHPGQLRHGDVVCATSTTKPARMLSPKNCKRCTQRERLRQD